MTVCYMKTEKLSFGICLGSLTIILKLNTRQLTEYRPARDTRRSGTSLNSNRPHRSCHWDETRHIGQLGRPPARSPQRILGAPRRSGSSVRRERITIKRSLASCGL